MTEPCVFCRIRDRNASANIVFDDDETLAFLDKRPLFHGHVLVIPKEHHSTMFDLPPVAVAPLFETTRRVAIAVKTAMGADGIFLASNNGVSQSVDHLHVHVVPRRKKDGLRGFMWPRLRYADDDEAQDIAGRIRTNL